MSPRITLSDVLDDDGEVAQPATGVRNKSYNGRYGAGRASAVVTVRYNASSMLLLLLLSAMTNQPRGYCAAAAAASLDPTL